MDVFRHNAAAWDIEVAQANPWAIPASAAEVAAAREGRWGVKLTNTQHAPRSWFPAEMRGVRILALASGGGQQAPILAAAGADVTVLDASPAQLAQDRLVAAREKLVLRIEQGDMADLSRFPDGSFDLVFNPVSSLFIPEVLPVWRECYRVLRPGGSLLAGFLN
ncbi:MAG: class I SAM-dependent methyltransferase, partial [Candidatus Thermoplasmatota archaeon]